MQLTNNLGNKYKNILATKTGLNLYWLYKHA